MHEWVAKEGPECSLKSKAVTCQHCSLKKSLQGWSGIYMFVFKRTNSGYSKCSPQSTQIKCCASSSKYLCFCSSKFRIKKKYCSYSKIFLTLISKRILRSPNIINDQCWSNLISILSIVCLKGQILVLRKVWSSDYAAVLILVVLFLYTWYIFPVYVHKLYCIMF